VVRAPPILRPWPPCPAHWIMDACATLYVGSETKKPFPHKKAGATLLPAPCADSHGSHTVPWPASL
jgi:hypothetical protein